MKQIQKNLTDLHKRLYTVLPQYQPISAYKGNSGTYKAITSEGNVYLVTWEKRDGEPPRRREEFVMDYFTLCRKSDQQVAELKPEDGWDIDEAMI